MANSNYRIKKSLELVATDSGGELGLIFQDDGAGNINRIWHNTRNGTFLGANAGRLAAGALAVNNVGLGKNSLDALTDGDQNTAAGDDSGGAVTTGQRGTYLGYQAGAAVTTSDDSVMVGAGSGANVQTANNNVLVGKDAGPQGDVAGCVMIGYQAGNNETSANDFLKVNGDMQVTGDLTVDGTTTTTHSENVLINDNHLYLNNAYTTAVAQTGGLVVNYLPTATTDTVAATGFTAGVAAVSNPTVNTVAAATFNVGDLIQINGANDPSNDGLFEVLSHAANLLTIRGVGITGCVEDFTQNDFVTDTTVAGTIYKVNVSVIRAGTDGAWEVGQGSTTGISFTDIATGSSLLWSQTGTAIHPTTITNDVTIGTTATSGVERLYVFETEGASANVLATYMQSQVTAGTSAIASVLDLNMDAQGGTITAGYGLRISVSAIAGAITSMYGIEIADLSSSGSTTTAYGIYIGNQTAATAYGIYQAGNTEINYFGARVGINDSAPSSTTKLRVKDDDETNTTIGIELELEKNAASAKGGYTGVYNYINYTGGVAPSKELTAFHAYSYYNAGVTTPGFFNYLSEIETDSGDITLAIHYDAKTYTDTGDTVVTAYAFRANAPSGAGAITTAYGLYVADQGNSSTTAYGVYIADQTATTAYGLYQAAAGDLNVLLGDVAIGVASMSGTEKLRVSGDVLIDSNGTLTIGNSGTDAPLNITQRNAAPAGSVAVGDIYLDDGTNWGTADGTPGFRRLVSTGPDVWEDIAFNGSAGDIGETTFNMANNQVAAANVTGLAFADASVRSFEALVSVEIDATADLFETFILHGVNKGISGGVGWDMTVQSTGDDSNIDFTITATGQVQYTSGNEAGFVTNVCRFRAITTNYA